MGVVTGTLLRASAAMSAGRYLEDVSGGFGELRSTSDDFGGFQPSHGSSGQAQLLFKEY